jgi:hypothetical protein
MARTIGTMYQLEVYNYDDVEDGVTTWKPLSSGESETQILADLIELLNSEELNINNSFLRVVEITTTKYSQYSEVVIGKGGIN